MLSYRLLATAALGLVLLAAPAMAAAPAAFTEGQKDEIRAVVKDYLVQHPEVMEEVLTNFQTYMQKKEEDRINSLVEANYVDLSSTASGTVMGNPAGSITVIEFFDYQCGYCKKITPDLKALIDDNKDVKLVLREFPILGEASIFAAKAALASRAQGKYVEFHNKLMGVDGHLNQEQMMNIAKSVGLDTTRLTADMESIDVDTEIRKNYRLAQMLGIQSTPTILIGKKLYQGAMGLDNMSKAVAAERKALSPASNKP
jgi:protein-disulfide isomerase